MNLTLKQIAKILSGTIDGEPSLQISGINTLQKATLTDLSFATGPKYIDSLSKTQAGVVIINDNLKMYCPTNAIIVEDTHLAFAIISHEFKLQTFKNKSISSENKFNEVFIDQGCFIGENVKIGKKTIIEANCVIENNVSIGERSRIGSNVTIQNGCRIGDNCIILPGAVIGSEGFGNARTIEKKWYTIAHLGSVEIGDNVSIGSNTTIDRGTIQNTEIHNGVRIDNLVHIAHNVIIGEDTAIAAKTGIAGTTIIGKRCMIGGMVGIIDHLVITDDVIVNATSTVNRNITKPGIYTGFVPLMLHSEWKKVGVWLTKLDKIATLLKIKLKNIK